MEETNKPRLNFLVKTPIIIIAIFIFINDYNDLIDYYNTVGNNGGLLEYFKIAFNTTILRTSLMMLIPLIGIFFNTKIGWLLVISFYYFWINLCIYLSLSSNLERSGTIVAVSGIIIISLFLILIMNSSENSHLVYGIKKDELFTMNTAAILLATIEIILIIFLNITQ